MEPAQEAPGFAGLSPFCLPEPKKLTGLIAVFRHTGPPV